MAGSWHSERGRDARALVSATPLFQIEPRILEAIVDEFNLTADEVLTTTRAVRKRLDLNRPVERSLIEECLAIAQQAPSSSNRQHWHFVVVTDPVKRTALGELYGTSWRQYNAARSAPPAFSPERLATQNRVLSSARYLSDNMGKVPVLVIPCVRGRTEGAPIHTQAATWGTILPAAWSFMLAARARGLGTAWTTLHLVYEKEAAALLGIPYDEVMQAAMIPLAHTIGSDFKPGPREPLESIVHWEKW
jgi:nitroreductase